MSYQGGPGMNSGGFPSLIQAEEGRQGAYDISAPPTPRNRSRPSNPPQQNPNFNSSCEGGALPYPGSFLLPAQSLVGSQNLIAMQNLADLSNWMQGSVANPTMLHALNIGGCGPAVPASRM